MDATLASAAKRVSLIRTRLEALLASPSHPQHHRSAPKRRSVKNATALTSSVSTVSPSMSSDSELECVRACGASVVGDVSKSTHTIPEAPPLPLPVAIKSTVPTAPPLPPVLINKSKVLPPPPPPPPAGKSNPAALYDKKLDSILAMVSRAVSLLQLQGSGIGGGMAESEGVLTWGKAGSNMKEDVVVPEEYVDIREAMLKELKERIAHRQRFEEDR